jgi:hypothetical protein
MALAPSRAKTPHVRAARVGASRPVAARDIVVWRKEPHFPRLVADLTPKKATLLEPGDQAGSDPLKVQPIFLLPLDFTKLRAAPT